MAHFAFAYILETPQASKIIELYDKALEDKQPTPATWVLNQLAPKEEEIEFKKLAKEVIRKIHPDKYQKSIDNEMFTRFKNIMNEDKENIKTYAKAKTSTFMKPTQVPASQRMTRVFETYYVPSGLIPRVYVPTIRPGHIPPTGRHVYIQPTGSPGYFLYIPHNSYIVYEKRTEGNIGKEDNSDRSGSSQASDKAKNHQSENSKNSDDGEDSSEDSADSDDEDSSEDLADSDYDDDSDEDASNHFCGFWNSWFPSCCRRRRKN